MTKAASAETGWFPSLTSRGRPRIGSDGTQLRELRLRCLRDGSVRSFVDDGGSAVEANQQRQQLIRMLVKVDRDSGLPVFFLDNATEPARVPAPVVGSLPIPIANKEIKSRMGLKVDEREGRRDVAEKLVKREGDALVKKVAAKGLGAPDLSLPLGGDDGQ